MSAARLPCPRCGRLLHPSALVCPSCGAQMMLHKRRFRCRHCGRRVPVDSTRCPYCLSDPRRFYFRGRYLIAIVAVVAIGAFAFTLTKGPPWFSQSSQAQVAYNPPPTSTVESRHALPPVVTATPLVSDTPLATTVPTQAPAEVDASPTVLPSIIPSRTASPTQRPATRVPTKTAIPPPPRLPPAPLPTWTPIRPNAPILLSPDSGVIYLGPRHDIQLLFQPVEILHFQQFHRVEVDYVDSNGYPAAWCGWTPIGVTYLPGAYYSIISPFSRTIRWHVNIAQAYRDNPSTCAEPSKILSAPSAEWIINWY